MGNYKATEQKVKVAHPTKDKNVKVCLKRKDTSSFNVSLAHVPSRAHQQQYDFKALIVETRHAPQTVVVHQICLSRSLACAPEAAFNITQASHVATPREMLHSGDINPKLISFPARDSAAAMAFAHKLTLHRHCTSSVQQSQTQSTERQRNFAEIFGASVKP